MDDDDESAMWNAWEEEQAADWLAWYEQNGGKNGNEEDRVAATARAFPGASDQPFA
jgi:hypothetical protein